MSDAVQVAVGGDHGCALRRGGQVVCWGNNDMGQLGDGTRIESNNPVEVDGLTDAVRVAAGGTQTCALSRGGALVCWGEVRPGQGSALPERMLIDDATDVSAGRRHTCAVRADGTVLCWGYNGHGQIGDGAAVSYRPEAVEVEGVAGAFSVSAGGDHTCAVLRHGEVTCWGYNRHRQLGDLEQTANDLLLAVNVAGVDAATSVTAGTAHTCALLDTGRVVCWGWSSRGQLGNGVERTPAHVVGSEGARAIAAGGMSCALYRAGGVECWGLGRRTPTRVPGVDDAASLSVGLAHACVVLRSGGILCWGEHASDDGESRFVYGDGTRPTRIEGISDALEVAAGTRHTCARFGEGSVSCWGSGYLGDGTRSFSRLPVAVGRLGDAVRIAAGQDKTYAVRRTGGVVCWGDCGELGPDLQEAPFPVAVAGIDDAAQVAVAVHACILRSSGQVICLGNNEYGFLGDEGANPRARRVTVAGLVDAVEVTAGLGGGGFSCALRKNGEIACWGDNDRGQLGNGTTTPETVPSPVVGVAAAQSVAAGDHHACALLRTGGVVCWGSNESGDLGAGLEAPSTRLDQPMPVTVLTGCGAVTGGRS